MRGRRPHDKASGRREAVEANEASICVFYRGWVESELGGSRTRDAGYPWDPRQDPRRRRPGGAVPSSPADVAAQTPLPSPPLPPLPSLLSSPLPSPPLRLPRLLLGAPLALGLRPGHADLHELLRRRALVVVGAKPARETEEVLGPPLVPELPHELHKGRRGGSSYALTGRGPIPSQTEVVGLSEADTHLLQLEFFFGGDVFLLEAQLKLVPAAEARAPRAFVPGFLRACERAATREASAYVITGTTAGIACVQSD